MALRNLLTEAEAKADADADDEEELEVSQVTVSKWCLNNLFPGHRQAVVAPNATVCHSIRLFIVTHGATRPIALLTDSRGVSSIPDIDWLRSFPICSCPGAGLASSDFASHQ